MKVGTSFFSPASGLKLLACLLLFLLGLVGGGLVLTPWGQVWTMALNKADKALDKAEVRWAQLKDASPLGFTLEHAEVVDPSGKVLASLKRLDVRLGLVPLSVTLDVDTGKEARAVVYRSGRLVMRGEVDLDTLLGRRDIRGVVRLDGDLSTRKWRTVPESGRIELHARAVVLPGDIRAQGVSSLVEMSGDVVALRSFTAMGPVPVKATGSVTLNWKNLKASAYQVNGQITFGDKPTPFEYKGHLGNIAWLPL